jgi:hypothetical protein
MRLFVYCGYCKNKFYIASPAKLRSEIPQSFYLTCPICHQTYLYTSKHVFAETSETFTGAGGALVGGLAGLLLGGIPALIGAIAGAILGGGKEKHDSDAVKRFNIS